MTMNLRTGTAQYSTHGWMSPLLWVVAAASVTSHVATVVLHLPQGVGGAMMASSLTLFGLLHGASTYGWRGILFFLVVCLGVSNAFENLSIMTGFPFGWYHYSNAIGPKLFLVPLLIGPAYFGMGYLSWTLARTILSDEDTRLAGLLWFVTPVIASFIMVSWDLTIDPMMSTINGSWVFPMLCFVRQTQVRDVYENTRILGHAAIRLHVNHHGSDSRPVAWQ